MIYYSIREKSTGFFLPTKIKGSASGITSEEPKEFCIPKLYRTKKGANQALKMWLEGAYQQHWYDNGDGGDVGIKFYPMPNRKLKEMEVVKIELRVRK